MIDGNLLFGGTAGTTYNIWNYQSAALTFGTANEENMRISTGGNVGIGTTTPGTTIGQGAVAKLHVESAGHTGMIVAGKAITDTVEIDLTTAGVTRGSLGVERSTGGYMLTGSGAYSTILGTQGAYPLHLFTNTAIKMTILSDGNVGIGTTGPGAKLEVAGNILTPAESWVGPSSANGVYFKGGLVGVGQDVPGSKLSVQGGLSVGVTGGTYSSTAAPTGGAIIDGNVGIGTTDPGAYKLYVQGNMIVNAGEINIANNGGNPVLSIGDSITAGNYGSLRWNSAGDYMALETQTGGAGLVLLETGNVGIGTVSPAAKLDIADTTLAGSGSLTGSIFNLAQTWNTTGAPTAIKLNVTNTADGGTGNFSTTKLMDLQVGGTSQFSVDKTGQIFIAGSRIGSAGALLIVPDGNLTLTGNQRLFLNANSSTGNTGVDLISFANNATDARTSGTGSFIGGDVTFAPASGTAVWSALSFRPTVNQTGGANGITRGLFISPTITAATDFRAIETTVGNVIFGSTSGNVGIGTTAPTGKLDVVGSLVTARVLTTGSLSLIGTDATASAQTVLTLSTGVGNATGPNIVLSKSRDQSSGAIVNNDVLGTIQFQGGNATASVEGSRIQSISTGTWSGSSRPNYLSFWTTALNSTTVTEQMRIDQNGNVGIGTTNPGAKLSFGGTFPNVYLYESGTDVYGLGAPGGGIVRIFASTGASNRVDIGTYDATTFTPKMSIGMNGNVGIGTTAPGAKLDIAAGAADADTEQIRFSRTNDGLRYNSIYSLSQGSGTARISFKVHDSVTTTSQATVMSLLGSGNVGIGTTAPVNILDVKGAIFTGTYASTAGARFHDDVYGVNLGGIDASTVGVIQGSAYGVGAANIAMQPNGGNVGIGTVAPTAPLTVQNAVSSTNENILYLKQQSANYGYQFNIEGVTTGNLYLHRNALGVLTNLVTIQPSGNVGIGTTGPGAKLDVNGDTYVRGGISIYGTATTAGYQGVISNSETAFNIYGSSVGGSGKYLTLNPTGGVEGMRILSGGNVGIGTTAPSSKLDVFGILSISNTASSRWDFDRDDSTGYLTISDTGTQRMTIDTSGNVGIGTTAPTISGQTRELDIVSTAAASSVGLVLSGTRTADGFLGVLDFANGTTRVATISGNRVDADNSAEMRFYTNNAGGGLTQQMVISKTGNVGIGTASPTSVIGVSPVLHIKGATGAPVLRLQSANGTSGGVISIDENEPMRFFTYDNERLRILGNGNVGIGDTSPASLFVVGSGDLFQVNSSGAIAAATGIISSGALVLSGVGPHAIGGATAADNGLAIRGTFTPTNASDTPYGTRLFQTINANAASGIMYGVSVDPTMVEYTSGTHPSVIFLNVAGQITAGTADVTNAIAVDVKTFIAQTTTTNAYSLRLAVPTGATNNYALYSTSGTNYFGGNVGIGTTAPGAKLDVNGNLIVTNAGSTGVTIVSTASVNRPITITPGVGSVSPSITWGASDSASLQFGDSIQVGGTGGSIVGRVNVYGGNSTDTGLRINNTNADVLFSSNYSGSTNHVGTPTGYFGIGTSASAPFALSTAGTVKVVVTSGGNVGIGTTGPGYKLTILSATEGDGLFVREADNGNNAASLQGHNGGGKFQLLTGGTVTVNFDASGAGAANYINTGANVGIGTTGPDTRLDVSGGNIQVRTASDGGIVLTTPIGDTRSATIESKKSRGTYAAPTDVVNGDDTFKIFGSAFSYSQYFEGASLTGAVDGTFTSNQRPPSRLNFYTNTANSVPTEKMRIDKSGNVGIGTTAPVYQLQVADTGGTIAIGGTPTGNGEGNLKFVTSNNKKNWNIAVNQYISGSFNIGRSTATGGSTFTTADLTIDASGRVGIGYADPGTAKLAIDGNVGIGTTAPGQKLDVVGNIQLSGNLNWSADAGGNIGNGNRPNNIQLAGALAVNAGLGANGTVSTGGPIIVPLGSVTSPSYTFSGDLNTGVWSSVADTLNFSTGGSERVRIDTSGNVGIGTTGPGAPLEVFRDGSGADVTAGGIILSRYQVGGSYRGGAIYSRYISSGGANDSLVFAVSEGANPYTDFSMAKMVIAVSGRVGIGTTAPVVALHVDASGGGIVRVSRVGAGAGIMQMEADGTNGTLAATNAMIFNTASTERMRILSGGNVGIGLTNPEAALEVYESTAVTNSIANVITVQAKTTGTFAAGFGPSIKFMGSMTGQDNVELGHIGAINTNGSGAYGNLVFYTRPNGTSLERMRIDNNGNVGIGTTAPDYKLMVEGADAAILAGLKLQTTQAAATGVGIELNFRSSATGRLARFVTAMEASNGDSYLAIETSVAGTGNERLRITSAGNVGIGTTNPTTKLYVSGDIYTTGNMSALTITDRTAYPKDIAQAYDAVMSMQRLPDGLYDENNREMQLDHATLSSFIKSASGERDLSASVSSINEVTKYLLNQFGGINSSLSVNSISGNVGIGTTAPAHKLDVVGTAGLTTGTAWTNTSDVRLKTIESGLTGSSLDKLLQLNPISFRWNELHNQKYGLSSDKLNFGFVAQEVELIFPSLISTDAEGYKWYNPSGFEAILTAAMQEMDLKVEGVEERTDFMLASLLDMLNQATTTLALDIASTTAFALTLETRLSALEQMMASSTALTATASTSPNIISDVLLAMGASIVDGITHFKQLAIESLTAFALTVGRSDKPAGITIYDQLNGEPYCLKVMNGQSVTTAGDCSTPTNNSQPTTNNTQTSTPDAPVEPEVGTPTESVGAALDTTAPVITLTGASTVDLTVGGVYTEEGATVTDDVDTSVVVVISGSVDTATVGVYTITYNATDTAGNQATPVTRTVNVAEATPTP